MDIELDPLCFFTTGNFKDLYLEDYTFLLDSAKQALIEVEEEKIKGNVEEACNLKNKAVSLEMAASLIMATALKQPVDFV